MINVVERQQLGLDSVQNPYLCRERRRDLFFRTPRHVQSNTTIGLWCGDVKRSLTQQGSPRLFSTRRGNRRGRTIWRAEAHFISFIVMIVAAAAAAAAVSVNFGGGCPNACSRHGYCTSPSMENCSCHQGWGGGDCSIRLCPSGNAWIDYPTGNNMAHAPLTECSNMGVCDRSTGLCSCRAGFTGEACQRLACPDNCNDRGRCMSMHDAAAVIDGNRLEFEGVYEGWDADMIHGCVCDDGWNGFDCSLRSCPRGVDLYPFAFGVSDEQLIDCYCPRQCSGSTEACAERSCPKGVDPYPVAYGVSEEQLIDCYCPDQCSGSLRLGFRGHSTRLIPFDASAELIKYRLEELDTVKDISVNISGPGGIICNGSDGATTRVTFLLQHGSLSNLTADVATLRSTSTSPSVAVFTKGQASDLNPHLWSSMGTKITQECSNRGYCNRLTGHCMCYSKFFSSDGNGGLGDLGDCGYYDPFDPPTNCSTATPLWGSTKDICSGAGNCDMETIRCNCTEGYTGGACELKECNSSVAWFEEAAWNASSAGMDGGRTDNLVQCSAGGVCDESTGICTCRSDIFTGNDCAIMACPTCSDVGTCKDIEYFASTATNNGEATPYTYDLWDANKMRSCWCNRTRAVDMSFTGTSDTYRGPYSFADTDSYGFDCSLGRCPTGDNSRTVGVTDVQLVKCTGGWGVFSLSFRDASTGEIPFDITAEDFEIALEATPWIHDVDVTFFGGNSACRQTDYIRVEFLTEHGDLPLMKPYARQLFSDVKDTVTRGEVTVEKVRTGTQEELECAAHGICLEDEGVCDCFVGYQSSDGMGGKGHRGDCGWRNEYQTALFTSAGEATDYN